MRVSQPGAPNLPGIKGTFSTRAAGTDQQQALTVTAELVLGEHHLNGSLKVFNHSKVVPCCPKLEKKTTQDQNIHVINLLIKILIRKKILLFISFFVKKWKALYKMNFKKTR